MMDNFNFDSIKNDGYSGVIRMIRELKLLITKFEQFIKFVIVGCSNASINLLVYYVCIYLGIHYILAYTLGFLLGVCNAFYWNSKYVFKNKTETNIARGFVKVLLSYGLSFLLSVLLMGVIVETLKFSSYIAPILKLVITVPLNFVLNKLWAFKENNSNFVHKF